MIRAKFVYYWNKADLSHITIFFPIPFGLSSLWKMEYWMSSHSLCRFLIPPKAFYLLRILSLPDDILYITAKYADLLKEVCYQHLVHIVQIFSVYSVLSLLRRVPGFSPKFHIQRKLWLQSGFHRFRSYSLQVVFEYLQENQYYIRAKYCKLPQAPSVFLAVFLQRVPFVHKTMFSSSLSTILFRQMDFVNLELPRPTFFAIKFSNNLLQQKNFPTYQYFPLKVYLSLCFPEFVFILIRNHIIPCGVIIVRQLLSFMADDNNPCSFLPLS